MSSKIKQIKLLISLEEKKLSEALLNYTKSNQICINAKAQYQQLIAYQAEYAMVLSKKNNMQAHTLGVYYNFIDKLDHAIKEQSQKVNIAKENSAQLFQRYLVIKKKSDGLENLLDKEIAIQRNKQAKQEQKQYDEAASSQWFQDQNNKK